MKTGIEAAVTEYLLKRIKNADGVPVGDFDISGIKVTVTIPENTTVRRDAGFDGNGNLEYVPTVKALSKKAIALFCKYSGITGENALRAWEKALSEAVDEECPADDKYPEELEKALEKVNAKLAESKKAVKSTQVNITRNAPAVEIVYPQAGSGVVVAAGTISVGSKKAANTRKAQ